MPSKFPPNVAFRLSPQEKHQLVEVARRLGTTQVGAFRRLVAGYLEVLDDLKEVRADRRVASTSSRDLPGVERH